MLFINLALSKIKQGYIWTDEQVKIYWKSNPSLPRWSKGALAFAISCLFPVLLSFSNHSCIWPSTRVTTICHFFGCPSSQLAPPSNRCGRCIGGSDSGKFLFLLKAQFIQTDELFLLKCFCTCSSSCPGEPCTCKRSKADTLGLTGFSCLWLAGYSWRFLHLCVPGLLHHWNNEAHKKAGKENKRSSRARFLLIKGPGGL